MVESSVVFCKGPEDAIVCQWYLPDRTVCVDIPIRLPALLLARLIYRVIDV
jgi:hypothetical protein